MFNLAQAPTVLESGQRFSIDGALLTAHCLDYEVLWHLFNGTVSALRVPNFYNVSLGYQLAEWIEKHPSRKVYTHEVSNKDNPNQVEYRYYHVDRVGYPRNQLIGKPANHGDWQLYWQQRDQIMQGMRIATNNHHPIEQLMQALNRHWQAGAELEQVDGNCLFAGIGRITVAGMKTLLSELPHVDGAWPYDRHFSANVYLRMPETGGELEIWQSPTLTYEQVRDLDSDFNWRSQSLPSQLIRPQEGDLIIINTRRPHAVLGYQSGTRVSVASFIGFNGDQPLKLYS